MRSRGLRVILFAGLILALMAAFVGTATGQETDWSTLIEQAKPAVVWIVVETSEGTFAGSGVIISPNGYILTAGHVVKGANKITVVVEESEEYSATIVNADYDMDVALLKIPASGLTWLALGDSDKVHYDEEIQVLGYPLPQQGVGYIAVAGKVQGFRTYKDVTLIQHDAPTEAGHSGGPVIDAQGEIIAVHTSWIGGKHSKYTIGVAINSARRIIPSGVIPTGPSPVKPAPQPGAHVGPIRVPQDYPTIQAAVRAAGEGAEITVSSGTYQGDVTIAKPLTIVGEAEVVIRGSIRILSANSVYLRDLTIQGGVEVRSSKNVTLESLLIKESQGDGLLVAEASVSVRGSTIQDNQGDGVVATFQSHLVVTSCTVKENKGTGINVTLGSQAFIVRNMATGNGSDGIAVFGATADLHNNILRQNEGYGLNADATATLTGAGNQAGADIPEDFPTITAAVRALNKQGGKSSAVPAGIISTAISIGPGTYKEAVDIARSVDLIGAGSTRTIVEGIKITGAAHVLIQDLAIMGGGFINGIRLEDTAQATIKNCTISGNGDGGIFLTDSAQAMIENCTISKNEHAGIFLYNTAQATIENCTISGNNGDGIFVTDSAQAELQDNVIRRNGGYGIRAEDKAIVTGENNIIPGGNVPSEYPTIQAALDGGNGDGAIDARVPTGFLKHATITIAPGTYEESVSIKYSVDLIGSGSARTTVRGIQVSGAAQLFIDYLAITSGGISITDTAAVTIRNCVISDSRSAGIYLEDKSQATIDNCEVSESGGYGICLSDTAKASLQNCTVSGNGYEGIVLWDSAQATIVNNYIYNNALGGVKSRSSEVVAGHDNKMWNNGVDLAGNVPGSLRVPLEPATQQEIHFPDPHYNSLQSAVDALIPGGRLIIQAGEYEVGLTIAKQIEVTTAEGAQVTLQARSENAPVFSLVRSADLTLSGITVTKGEYGLVLGGDAKATIKACSILGNEDDSMLLRDSSKATIKACTISGNGGNGIRLDDSAQATVDASTISRNDRDGIAVRDTALARVEHCTISENKEYGIYLYDTAQATILNNDINSNIHAGISALSYFFGKITGHDNTMWHNGVDLEGNVPGSLRVPLEPATQQEIHFPDPHYDSLQSAVDALIPGGRLIIQAGEYEIGLTIAKQIDITAAEGAQVTLRGRSEAAPVLSLVRNADLTLSGIAVTKGEYGLVLGGDAKATIKACSILGNEDDSMLLRGTSKATIKACTISGNGGDGIFLQDTSKATIENCTILESGIGGIVLWDSAQATILDCTISENYYIGITLENSAQATIQDCTLSRNDIELWESAKATIEGCRITNNDSYGIKCSEFTGQVTGSGNYIPGPEDPDGNKKGALDPKYPGDPWPQDFLKEQVKG